MQKLTAKQFWKAIEERTSEDAADFGWDGIAEEDLPGVIAMKEDDARVYVCADLDATAAYVQREWDAFRTRGDV